MKVLVTGATGFVGSHLCDQLSSTGNHVYSLVRSKSKADAFQVPGHYLIGDLSNFDWIKELPEDLEAVVHTAGIVHSFDEQEFFDVNAEATKKLIDALKKRYDKLHFILVSSQAAGGPASKEQPATETSRNAVSQYGHSKLKAEVYAHAMRDQWTVSIVRPPMVIGPRDPAVLDIFKMVASGIVFSPAAPVSQKVYSYVCVFDLVQFFVHLLESKQEGTFYCAYPTATTLQNLINDLAAQLKRSTISITLPVALLKLAAAITQFLGQKKIFESRLTKDKLNELIPAQWVCDSSKSQTHGFQYKWNLTKTLKATLLDYQKRKWI